MMLGLTSPFIRFPRSHTEGVSSSQIFCKGRALQSRIRKTKIADDKVRGRTLPYTDADLNQYEKGSIILQNCG